jgi:Fe-S-cluster-containing hydrogenase component 2
VNELHQPLQSLKEGHWFKLICGASFQHLPAIRSLTLAYALAGADCIDVAADPAVVNAAREALQVLPSLVPAAREKGYCYQSNPWLMVSLNDGEDPHFRKAEFDVSTCPVDCWQPCKTVCPAQAIVFQSEVADSPTQVGVEQFSGVLDDRCYGCGRCLPVCPVQNISARSYVYTPEVVAPLVLEMGVDALEIHTQIGRLADFKRLWQSVTPWLDQLKLIAISCPDGEGLIDYLWDVYRVMQPLHCVLVWQTDGRPMSGDIGIGTTKAAVKLGQKVLAAKLPGFVQLAGGTNQHTVAKLRELGLLQSETKRRGKVVPESAETFSDSHSASSETHVAGVAYGSCARVLLASVIEELEEKMANFNSQLINPQESGFQVMAERGSSTVVLPRSSSKSDSSYLENHPDLLWRAVSLAYSLTSQLKSSVGAQSSTC